MPKIDDTRPTHVVYNNGKGVKVVRLVGRDGVEARVEAAILGGTRSSERGLYYGVVLGLEVEDDLVSSVGEL